MIINANTKIAAILKYRPDALEYIIGINPKFEKLRNPVLRKLMAARTSIAMAAKMGGCSVEDFYRKLEPMGFEIDHTALTVTVEKKQLPGFIASIKTGQLIDLDVRPIIASGEDPLSIINKKVKTLQPGQVLKIINNFEPIPLILLLEKKGFVAYTDIINDDWVETYFYKKAETFAAETIKPVNAHEGWDNIIQKFKGNIRTIDVRELEMPLPMLTILDALDKLPVATALYVYHKRIPVFLLPELAERKFDYRINEISNSEVHLLIFKD